jgi:modulator of FtsH protease HflC
MVKIAIIAVVCLVVLGQSVFVVNEWEQAIILEFGKPERTIRDPGLYFKAPFVQDLITFDKRILAAEARPAEYITLDKKRLTVDTVSRWKIDDPLIFYQTVTNPVGATARLNNIISTRLRQEVANHNFKEFIREKREFIMDQVTQGTAELAKQFGIRVLDVRIKRVDLPEEVLASVFARMKAERERIAKRYRAEGDEQARQIRADANKEKEIILAEAYKTSETLRGEGDAEATHIYAAAYGKDAEFYSFMRHMEVYQRILSSDTTLLLRPDSTLLRYLDSPTGAKSGNPPQGTSSAPR